jgi:hypothetical protein
MYVKSFGWVGWRGGHFSVIIFSLQFFIAWLAVSLHEELKNTIKIFVYKKKAGR